MANLLCLMIIPFLLFLKTCNAYSNPHCSPSSCDNIITITSPFRLNTDPKECGYPIYELSCENNLTLLYFNSVKYFVHSINYANYTIRIVDSNLNKTNCSSLPNNYLEEDSYNGFRFYSYSFERRYLKLTKNIVFLECANPVNSSDYIDTAHCNIGATLASQHSKTKTTADHVSSSSYYYYVVDGLFHVSDLASSCRPVLRTLVSNQTVVNGRNTSFVDIHNQLTDGFEISWLESDFKNGNNECYFDYSNKMRCYASTTADAILSRIGTFIFLLVDALCTY
ncbi:uncharacterized protein LOC133778889 [Humulus lupulus]|uniref:uncharacterized protein LOC133778889 n=1 Tax=Humulus lupulus TaxID=3486 RepID=UPI002B4009FE|nr:uncharacterized protein LOC133778889 [Humulus lupulus]